MPFSVEHKSQASLAITSINQAPPILKPRLLCTPELARIPQ